jgi:glycosyltransferase involved in cell wall biosynthesis
MSVYILDPVCLQIAGHNLTAIKRYGALLSKLKREPIFLLPSKELSDNLCLLDITPGINVDRFFSHYYPDFIYLSGVKGFVDDSNSYQQRIFDLALKEAREFFIKYKPGAEDTIYYPSIDYFSLAALVTLLEINPQLYLCRFIFRFIGVMEFDHYNFGTELGELLSRLARLITFKRINLKISAESEVMAKYIKDFIDQDIEITPTLVNHDYLSYPRNSKYTIVFPGSARRDKGFDRIESILNKFESLGLCKDYNAIVQLLPPSELNLFSKSVLGIVRNAKVTLLPCTLDEEEIKGLYAMADVIVAPYDKKIYRYRSSAIMAETAIFGRPIIASKDCGFSGQISRHELGHLADSDEDFAREIGYFLTKGADYREAYGAKARDNFVNFTSESYKNLFL